MLVLIAEDMGKIPYVILAHFEDWTIEIIGKDGDIPARFKHNAKYVYYYLMFGKGLFIKRLTSVLIRLFTRTLKPSQVLSSN